MAVIGSRRVLLASGLLWLAFAVPFFGDDLRFSVGHVEAVCGETPLDVRFTSSAAEVDRFLVACGPDGRAAYRDMQLADLLYPAVFGLFMASALAASLGRLLARSEVRRQVQPRTTLQLRHRLVMAAAMVPLVGAAFDYGENAMAWSALLAYPEPIWTSSLLGVASAAKTTLFWLAGVILVMALVALLVRGVRSAVTGHRSTEHRGPKSAGDDKPTSRGLAGVGDAR